MKTTAPPAISQTRARLRGSMGTGTPLSHRVIHTPRVTTFGGERSGPLAREIQEGELDHGGRKSPSMDLHRPFDLQTRSRGGHRGLERSQRDVLLEDWAPRAARGPADLPGRRV